MPIVRRIKGLLTGSKSAALLAMIPLINAWETLASELVDDPLLLAPAVFCAKFHPGIEPPADAWQHYFPDTTERLEPESEWAALPALDKHLCLLAWVGNIYTFGVAPEASTKRMQSFADFRHSAWDLHLKEDSKEMLLPMGYLVGTLPEGYKLVQVMDALGHRIAHDGNCAPCVAKAIHSSWQAYWRNFGKLTRGFSARARCQLFSRAVSPCMRYRFPRWTWLKTLATTTRRQQSKDHGESWQAFGKRKQAVLSTARCIWWDEEWPMRVR
jgi:hypothetical protein